MDRAAYRKEMLAYCLDLMRRAGATYATWAAGWYEKNEPWYLDGLKARITQEVEKTNGIRPTRKDRPLHRGNEG